MRLLVAVCWSLLQEMSDDLKNSKVRQIAVNSNRPRAESVLHTALKFRVDCTCFQGGKQSANFGGKVE